MKKEIGYIGLGKMGLAMVARLLEKKYRVVAWNRSPEPRKEARTLGAEVSGTLQGVIAELSTPRLLWLMVPSAVVDEVLLEIIPLLSEGDTIIDGGNSFYKDSMRRAQELAAKGINFLDVGTSGGPFGARNGACLMIGGDKKVFEQHTQLFQDLSSYKKHSDILQNVGMSEEEYAYAHLGKAGAGHFVKMVHNGIEYGMMQALGEGFDVMKHSEFELPLENVAKLYNRGSVIESRLVGWLAQAFAEHGEELSDISGEIGHLGEGEWTVKTASELGVPVPVIADSFKFRVASKENPSFTGKIVSALRNQFGGHEVKKQ